MRKQQHPLPLQCFVIASLHCLSMTCFGTIRYKPEMSCLSDESPQDWKRERENDAMANQTKRGLEFLRDTIMVADNDQTMGFTITLLFSTFLFEYWALGQCLASTSRCSCRFLFFIPWSWINCFPIKQSAFVIGQGIRFHR